MLFPKRLFTLFFISIPIIFSAVSCSEQPSANANVNAENKIFQSSNSDANSNNSSDNTAELGAMILLPFVPEETSFRETADVKNPSVKRLIAVLKFSPEDTKNLIAQAEKHRAPESGESGAEDWFPDELIAQAQLSGEQNLKVKTYGATDFMQMPYKTGKLMKVENSDYFILELSE